MTELTTVAQVGGDHYSSATGVQHWDYVEAMGLGYLEGCATKYLCRGDKKHHSPLTDYRKARSYVQKLLELHEHKGRDNHCLYAFGKRNAPYSPGQLAESYGLDLQRSAVIELLTLWNHAKHLRKAEELLNSIINGVENG